MADHCDRLALFEELADEVHGVLIRAQRVGVADPAGLHEAVVVRCVHFLDRLVDLEGVGLVVVVEALDLAGLQRHELRLSAGFLHGLPRLRQLDLFDHVGREERDLLALQLVRHGSSLRRFHGAFPIAAEP